MITKTKTKIFELSIPTADGEFVARYSEKGLCGLDFPPRASRTKGNVSKSELPPHIKHWHGQTARALAAALAGQAAANLPPLDLSSGTEFQQQVWRTLLEINCGRTLSYAQVAAAIGNPKALRAVGGACGANPIPVFVPCHRVLAANQALGGFSSGLDWKRRLLAREGFEIHGLPEW